MHFYKIASLKRIEQSRKQLAIHYNYKISCNGLVIHQERSYLAALRFLAELPDLQEYAIDLEVIR
jgi:hypothetical protein